MLLRNKWWSPKLAPDDGAGSGGGTGENGDGGATPPDGFVSKAELEKASGELAKLKQDLEDTKLEIFSNDYLEYLENKKAPVKKETPQAKETLDFSKMTPEQLYLKAKEDAKKEVQEEITSLKNDFTSRNDASVQKEVSAFARSHEDFEKYRPLMYGLSLVASNKDLTLQELYEKAKEHAKGFGPSEDDKGKSRRSSSEKPGGGSGSYSKDKKYTPESAAEEAWNDVVGDGQLPPAV